MLSFLSLSFLFSFLSFFFETKSHCVAQAGLELAIQFRLASNSPPFCLSLSGTGATGLGYWVELLFSNHKLTVRAGPGAAGRRPFSLVFLAPREENGQPALRFAEGGLAPGFAQKVWTFSL